MLNRLSMGPSAAAVRLASLVAWLATTVAVAVFAVGSFHAPSDTQSGFWVRGAYFWQKLLWFEVTLLMWFIANVFFGAKVLRERQQTGGGVVFAWQAWHIGIIGVLVLTAASSVASDRNQWWFVVAQLIVLSGVIFGASAATIARRMQNFDVSPIASDIRRPDELKALLATAESLCRTSHQPIAAELKALREKLTYSLPRVGQISKSTRYARLALETEELCAAIEQGRVPGPGSLAVSRLDVAFELLRHELSSR